MRGRPERRLLSLTLLARLSPSTSLTCAPRVLSRLVAGWGGAISAWWVGFLCGRDRRRRGLWEAHGVGS